MGEGVARRKNGIKNAYLQRNENISLGMQILFKITALTFNLNLETFVKNVPVRDERNRLAC